MCLLCRRKISFLPSRRRAASGLLAASFVGLGTYDDQLSKKGEKASKLDPELERRTSRFDRPIQEGEVDFEAAYADRWVYTRTGTLVREIQDLGRMPIVRFSGRTKTGG